MNDYSSPYIKRFLNPLLIINTVRYRSTNSSAPGSGIQRIALCEGAPSGRTMGIQTFFQNREPSQHAMQPITSCLVHTINRNHDVGCNWLWFSGLSPTPIPHIIDVRVHVTYICMCVCNSTRALAPKKIYTAHTDMAAIAGPLTRTLFVVASLLALTSPDPKS